MDSLHHRKSKNNNSARIYNHTWKYSKETKATIIIILITTPYLINPLTQQTVRIFFCLFAGKTTLMEQQHLPLQQHFTSWNMKVKKIDSSASIHLRKLNQPNMRLLPLCDHLQWSPALKLPSIDFSRKIISLHHFNSLLTHTIYTN